MAAEATGEPQLTMLVACFKTGDGATHALHAMQRQLRARREPLYDSVIMRVNARHHVHLYDPRRILAGVATATFTWGVFGLLTGSGVAGTVLSALSGAVLGGLYAYLHGHVLVASTLTRVGARLPADSSALALFTRGPDPAALIAQATTPASTSASVATIAGDLTAHIQPESARTAGDGQTDLSMVLVRYPKQGTAAVVRALPRSARIQVELVVRVEPKGRIHVTDPTHGVSAFARSDVVSWGGFGAVCGAAAGAVNGRGWIGLVGGALSVGLAWGLFGLLAGALYGLWAGRAVSRRRLHGLTQLLIPGTSNLLAWVDGVPTGDDLRSLTSPGSQQLVLRFAASGLGTALTTG